MYVSLPLPSRSSINRIDLHLYNIRVYFRWSLRESRIDCGAASFTGIGFIFGTNFPFPLSARGAAAAEK